MIEATSSYLARVKHSEVADPTKLTHYQDAKQQLAIADLSLEPNYKLLYQSFEFSKDIGRRYASVSKDYNPIHLSTASANLLGFRQAIAHGMYSKALCVSHSFARIPALRQRVLGSFNVYAEFMQPIYLPTKNTLVANEANTDQREPNTTISFRLASFKNGKTRDFLRGEVRAT
jgi:acyl dehydratase